jgi:hypothetical protein
VGKEQAIVHESTLESSRFLIELQTQTQQLAETLHRSKHTAATATASATDDHRLVIS